MVLGVAFPMGQQNRLGSSGGGWSRGRLSGARGHSQQGVLGEDAGFPKGPNLTALLLPSSWNRCKRRLCS